MKPAKLGFIVVVCAVVGCGVAASFFLACKGGIFRSGGGSAVRSEEEASIAMHPNKPPTPHDASTRTELSDNEKAAISAWIVADRHERAAEVGAICLRHRLAKAKVKELLGEPTDDKGNRIYYALIPSQGLTLVFDERGYTVRAWLTGSPINPDGSLGKATGIVW